MVAAIILSEAMARMMPVLVATKPKREKMRSEDVNAVICRKQSCLKIVFDAQNMD